MTQQLSKQLIVGALVMATTLVALFALRRAGNSPSQPPAITQPPRVPIALVDAAAPPQPTEALDPETRLLVGDAEAAARLYRASAEELPGLLCAFEAQTNPAVTYEALARNTDRFAGQLVTFRGRVLEVLDLPRQEGGGSFLRLGLNSYGDHVIAVHACELASWSPAQQRCPGGTTGVIAWCTWVDRMGALHILTEGGAGGLCPRS
jgi:hypothetical protein